MKTDNELIAEFMGLTTQTFEYDLSEPRVFVNVWKKMEYGKSWDWLMPAWVKFLKLLNDEGLLHRDFPYWGQWYSDITGAIIKGEIEKVHKLLVEGIKWYNDNSVTPKQ